MQNFFRFFFFVFVLIFSFTNGYPSGAPCSAALSFEPNHQGKQGNGPSPYSLQVLNSSGSKATEINGGEKYKVEITAQKPLKGIALKAIDASNTLRGDFQLDGSESSDACVKFMCPNKKSAITHSSANCNSRTSCSDAKPCKLQFTWLAPTSADTSIQFKFTGVLQYSEWYKSSTSALNYKGGQSEASAAIRRRTPENKEDNENFNPWGDGYSGK